MPFIAPRRHQRIGRLPPQTRCHPQAGILHFIPPTGLPLLRRHPLYVPSQDCCRRFLQLQVLPRQHGPLLRQSRAPLQQRRLAPHDGGGEYGGGRVRRGGARDLLHRGDGHELQLVLPRQPQEPWVLPLLLVSLLLKQAS